MQTPTAGWASHSNNRILQSSKTLLKISRDTCGNFQDEKECERRPFLDLKAHGTINEYIKVTLKTQITKRTENTKTVSMLGITKSGN